MCTYVTVREPMFGSAKGPDGAWFRVSDAVVYFDHPVHAMADHTLNIDLADPSRGPAARVAVELTADSARRLRDAIDSALRSAELPQGGQTEIRPIFPESNSVNHTLPSGPATIESG